MFQQLVVLEKALLLGQDAIKLAAKNLPLLKEQPLKDHEDMLIKMRQQDKVNRDRIYILQVAKLHGWEVAGQLSRKMGGEYDDPNLVQLLEKQEK